MNKIAIMDYLEEQFWQGGDMELVHLVRGVLAHLRFTKNLEHAPISTGCSLPITSTATTIPISHWVFRDAAHHAHLQRKWQLFPTESCLWKQMLLYILSADEQDTKSYLYLILFQLSRDRPSWQTKVWQVYSALPHSSFSILLPYRLIQAFVFDSLRIKFLLFIKKVLFSHIKTCKL